MPRTAGHFSSPVIAGTRVLEIPCVLIVVFDMTASSPRNDTGSAQGSAAGESLWMDDAESLEISSEDFNRQSEPAVGIQSLSKD